MPRFLCLWILVAAGSGCDACDDACIGLTNVLTRVLPMTCLSVSPAETECATKRSNSVTVRKTVPILGSSQQPRPIGGPAGAVGPHLALERQALLSVHGLPGA